MHILISFLISSVICWLFSSVLFTLHMLESYHSICLHFPSLLVRVSVLYLTIYNPLAGSTSFVLSFIDYY